jgi:hypothetical protein
MFKSLTRIAVIAVSIGVLATSASASVAASNGTDESALAAARQATDSFHDLGAAQHAGYHSLLSCFDLPGVGGMGQHYVNGSLINGTVNPNAPQALVYEVDGDRLQLVAVEYIVLFTQTAAPPQLYGRTFTPVTSLGLWALHAWIWRPNPLGMFANYNPNVEMCPGH